MIGYFCPDCNALRTDDICGVCENKLTEEVILNYPSRLGIITDVEVPSEYEIIGLDIPTAKELLEVLKHQFVSPEYTRVHKLLKQLWEFTK